MRIQHNMQAETALRVRKGIAEKQTSSMGRLSSGWRIMFSADDAAGAAISEKMRAQMRGLERAGANIKDAMNLVQTGDGAMQEVENVLHRIRELAVQAASDTNSPGERLAIEQEVTQLLNEIDDFSSKTRFNERAIIGDKPTVETNSIVKTTHIGTQSVNSTTTTKRSLVDPPDIIPQPGTEVTNVPETKTTANKEILSVTGLDVDDTGDIIYKTENFKETVVTEKTDYINTTTTEVEDVTDAATELANAVNSMGAPNFSTKIADSPINLYCALTRLDVRIQEPGDPPTYAQYNLYSDPSSIISRSTSTSGNVITTTFSFAGIELTQQLTLSGNDTYEIQLSINNVSGEDKTIDVKFAFDALNGSQCVSEDGGVTYSPFSDTNTQVWNSPEGDESIRLTDANNQLTIDASAISGGGNLLPSTVILDNIETMGSGTWDYTPSNNYDQHRPGVANSSYHSGLGFYWNAVDLQAGDGVNMGVKYGDVDFMNTRVCNVTITTTNVGALDVDTTVTEGFTTYKANNIVVQTNANSGDELKIPLLNLSTDMLGISDISLRTQAEASDALGKIDKAINLTSGLRAVWGALHNRMKEAFKRVAIGNENTTAAESRIRDVDMAKEMVELVKANILSDVSTAMLAQAKQSPEMVLQLLQQ